MSTPPFFLNFFLNTEWTDFSVFPLMSVGGFRMPLPAPSLFTSDPNDHTPPSGCRPRGALADPHPIHLRLLLAGLHLPRLPAVLSDPPRRASQSGASRFFLENRLRQP